MTPVIAYGLLCIFWALANARGIDANVWILHGANFVIHVCTVLYFGLTVHWALGLAMFFEGRLFFDTALSLFRFGWKRIGYVPAKPKSNTDKLEKAVFGNNGILPKVIYALCFIVCLIVYANQKL